MLFNTAPGKVLSCASNHQQPHVVLPVAFCHRTRHTLPRSIAPLLLLPATHPVLRAARRFISCSMLHRGRLRGEGRQGAQAQGCEGCRCGMLLYS